MTIYIVEIECFYIDGEYKIKEICVMNLLHPFRNLQHKMMIVKTPSKEGDFRTNRYLTNYFHKIPLHTSYDLTTLPYIPTGSMVLTHGEQKQKTLQQIYKDCLVINIFPTISYKNYSCIVRCPYFIHGINCSFNKCCILYNLINK